MKIGFKIILNKSISITTPDGFDGMVQEISVEINRYALSYEEMIQHIFEDPEKAYLWKDNVEYVANKIVRNVMKTNNITGLYKKRITFYIIPDDECTDYIVNFYPCNYIIHKVAYNLIDIDKEE